MADYLCLHHGGLYVIVETLNNLLPILSPTYIYNKHPFQQIDGWFHKIIKHGDVEGG